MVKALDLSSNGRMSAWVRTPLLVDDLFVQMGTSTVGLIRELRCHYATRSIIAKSSDGPRRGYMGISLARRQ